MIQPSSFRAKLPLLKNVSHATEQSTSRELEPSTSSTLSWWQPLTGGERTTKS